MVFRKGLVHDGTLLPVGSAPSVVRSLSANFHRASHKNNRFSSSGRALVAKTLNERLFVQLEAVYGDGRGHMEHGLIKVVAVLPFCKEVLSRQRPDPGLANQTACSLLPGRPASQQTQPFPHRAAVGIHALVRTLSNNNVDASLPAGRHSYPGSLWVAGHRTYPKEYRAVLESPKEQTL